MLKQEAIDFFSQWKYFTEDALKIVAPKCNVTTNKTRRYIHGHPIGIVFHYTGGPNGIASHRWGSENPKNTNSSWHATILDSRLTKLDHILSLYPLVKKYLPVTALFSGDLKKGTWHATWANKYCFGIENENMGRLRVSSVDGTLKFFNKKHVYKKLDKYPVLIRGQYWEPYTKGQLIANINIGRALMSIYGGMPQYPFNPNFILPHSCVDDGKTDTGSAYPIHSVRSLIMSDISLDCVDWLNNYGDRLPLNDNDVEYIGQDTMVNATRGNRIFSSASRRIYSSFDMLNKSLICREHLKLSLVLLGYNVLLDNFEEYSSDVYEAIKIFQTSKSLKIDGIVGNKTAIEILHRLQDFGHNTNFELSDLYTRWR